jgi:hypothetical protein
MNRLIFNNNITYSIGYGKCTKNPLLEEFKTPHETAPFPEKLKTNISFLLSGKRLKQAKQK